MYGVSVVTIHTGCISAIYSAVVSKNIALTIKHYGNVRLRGSVSERGSEGGRRVVGKWSEGGRDLPRLMQCVSVRICTYRTAYLSAYLECVFAYPAPVWIR